MAETIISKRCSKCKKIKNITEFFKNRSRKDGYDFYCKSCRTGQNSPYRKIYEKSDKGKKIKNKWSKCKKAKTIKKRYQQSKKGKVALYRYNHSDKGKSCRKRYEQSQKGRKTRIRTARNYEAKYPFKAKAAQAVRKAIRNGFLPCPNTLQCHYCHAQAKQYHHWNGYAEEYWLDVIPVCIDCHNIEHH